MRTFNLIGGSVIIELLGDGIAWRSSTPRSGYTVSVEETGPEKVVVEFESADPDNPHSSELEALWVDGRLEWKVEEED
ncbi:MAG: hypothetical protein HKO63_12000 [Acidimicrobiia bacterium]|nr:hypothetical protein [Acidimicrobiia bacterium]